MTDTQRARPGLLRALQLLDQLEDYVAPHPALEPDQIPTAEQALTIVRSLRSIVRTDPTAHEHGYTYSVLVSGSAAMTLGPHDLHDADDSADWLESLADNFLEWANSAGPRDLARQFIQRADLINTECFTHGSECPDNGADQDAVYVRPGFFDGVPGAVTSAPRPL